MRAIALLPVEKSSQEIVYQQLETLRIETGITPQGLLSDGGSDLTGGITRFCAAHPSALGFGDLPHQAALLLKKRLKDDERWSGFIKQATQTKFGTTMTDTIKAALLATPTKLVHRWVRENLGLTVQSKRTQLARILRLKLTENQQDP